MRRVRRCADPAELAETVAHALLERLVAIQREGRMPQIVLTGGSIADRIHRATADRAGGSGVDWTQVVWWWGDERFVASDSAERNARQARHSLLDVVGALPEQIHEVPAREEAADPDAAAVAYAREIDVHGGDTFDLVMLGVGPDGHVASLFPGSAQLAETDRLCVGVTGSPKPPPERVSLTFPALNRARSVWFVVSGTDKADAVARALTEPPPLVADLPAIGVTGSVETVWFVDRAAHPG